MVWCMIPKGWHGYGLVYVQVKKKKAKKRKE